MSSKHKPVSASARRERSTISASGLSFGFGGYSGASEISREEDVINATGAADGVSNKSGASSYSAVDVDDDLMNGNGDTDGSALGEGLLAKLSQAVSLSSKPNQQSKKKGLEDIKTILDKVVPSYCTKNKAEDEQRSNSDEQQRQRQQQQQQQQKVEVIVSSLMVAWSRVHQKCLRNEKNEELRLMSVRAHNKMCEKAGKRLAKCIGTTTAIPMLMIARCDSDRAVSESAESGFKEIFTSKERRGKALRFTALDFFEIVLESAQRAIGEFSSTTSSKNKDGNKERETIERDACACVRAIGQFAVDVFGFKEFREGKLVLQHADEIETNDDETTMSTTTTVKAKLESTLEKLDFLKSLISIQSSTSLRDASLDCLRKLFLDKCEVDEGNVEDTNMTAAEITFASFCEDRTAKSVLENVFARLQKEDDSFCLIKAWELSAGLSHARWGEKKLSSWEVHPELSRTVIDNAIVRGLKNAFEGGGAATGCAPCILPLFASFSLSKEKNSICEEERIKHTLDVVDAAMKGAKDCEQFQSKNAEADAIAKAAMECSLFTLLRWSSMKEKKEELLKKLLVVKWVPHCIEDRSSSTNNSSSSSSNNITKRWVDVIGKTVASLASKPTAFPKEVVISSLENLGVFLASSYADDPTQGKGICELLKAITFEIMNKNNLVPSVIHETLREVRVRFAEAIKVREEKLGGTDDRFLALAIETLSPDSFGGADEVANFIGQVTMNKSNSQSGDKTGATTSRGTFDTTSIESLFAALKFASAGTWAKHCEQIFKTQKLEIALPHIITLLKRFVVDNTHQALKCDVIDNAFVRACENVIKECSNVNVDNGIGFKAEQDFINAFANDNKLINAGLTTEAYKKGLSFLAEAVEKSYRESSSCATTTTTIMPKDLLCEFAWPPPPFTKEENMRNFWCEKVVAVAFMSRLEELNSENIEEIEEKSDEEEEEEEEEGEEEEEENARDFSRLCEHARSDSSWYAFLRSSYDDMQKYNKEDYAVLKQPLTKYFAEAIIKMDSRALHARTKLAHTILAGCFEVTNEVFTSTFLDVSDKSNISARFSHAIASSLGSWFHVIEVYVKKDNTGLVLAAKKLIQTMTELAPKYEGLLSAISRHTHTITDADNVTTKRLRDVMLDILVSTNDDHFAWELASLQRPWRPSADTTGADFLLARKILSSYGFVWYNEEKLEYPKDDTLLRNAVSIDSHSKSSSMLLFVLPRLLGGNSMDIVFLCLVNKIESYYGDRSVDMTKQSFHPAQRLFGYLATHSYVVNRIQKSIMLSIVEKRANPSSQLAEEKGAWALKVWNAIETREQLDKAMTARLIALEGRRADSSTASNEDDTFYDSKASNDENVENEIDNARILLAVLASAKTSSHLDEKSWARVFESMVDWIDPFARSSRRFLYDACETGETEAINVQSSLVVDRKFHLFELAMSCLGSIERFPLVVATPLISDDELMRENNNSLFFGNLDVKIDEVATYVDLDIMKSGGDVVAYASKSVEFGQALAKSLARAKWPSFRRVLVALAIEPFINIGAALHECSLSLEEEGKEEEEVNGMSERLEFGPILKEVSIATLSIAAIDSDTDVKSQDIFSSSKSCSLALRRFEMLSENVLSEFEIASSLNALLVHLDKNTQRCESASYLSFAILSSDDVVCAACFGIDCTFNDVKRIDKIVESRFREAAMLKEATNSELHDGEMVQTEKDVFVSEEAEQELLAKYGLRESLTRLLKKDCKPLDGNNGDDDENETSYEYNSDIACVDFAWSIVFRALSASNLEVPRGSKMRLIQYIAMLNTKYSIVSNAFNRVLNLAPFYELASLLADEVEEGEEVHLPVCDYGNHGETIRAFVPQAMSAKSSNTIAPAAFLALIGSFIEHFPAISRSAYRELDGKKSKKDFVNDLDFVCENVFRKAFLDREIADVDRFQNLRSSFASEKVSDALSVRYSEKMSAIVARYDVDESFFEISIDIPETFPLKPAEPRESKRVGVSEQRSRFWLLSLKTMLSSGSGLLNDEGYDYENEPEKTNKTTTSGSILMAIISWSKFVDKFFEGVEPCPICYQVLAKSNGRKPEATCRQCSNSYHGDCLMTWFKTSSKSTCPMCQISWGSSGL